MVALSSTPPIQIPRDAEWPLPVPIAPALPPPRHRARPPRIGACANCGASTVDARRREPRPTHVSVAIAEQTEAGRSPRRPAQQILSQLCQRPLFEDPASVSHRVTLVETGDNAAPSRTFCNAACFWTYVFEAV